MDVRQGLPETIPLVISGDMFIEVYLGHKIPSNLPLEIGEQELILNGEVDIGLRPANITPINYVNVVDC